MTEEQQSALATVRSPAQPAAGSDADAPALERARAARGRLPADGLFAGHEWRWSPDGFRLEPAVAAEIAQLGRVLLQFYRAADLLYRQSLSGRQPAWVARWLDQGKPASLLALQRSATLKHDLPRVIRPDLVITERGLALTELDSVPGGIGLTAWLNQTYAELGAEVVGGADGMLRGFAGIFGDAPQIHLVVSDEAGTYRPEMEWMAAQLRQRGLRCDCRDGTPFQPGMGDAVYRFFELFDLDNVPAAAPILRAAAERQIRLTPPPKSHLEEKLLLALLWNRNLREFWRQELGSAFLDRMQALVPFSWVVDPAPLPPHATLPRLELTEWRQLKGLSQRERDLILKVSGFSPLAWGARGVHLGSDLPAAEWAAVVDRALADFPSHPWILQRYEKPQTLPARWADLDAGRIVPMPGKVRLCPYYFVAGDRENARAELGGVLATVCPADKKLLHGMRDAVLAPCTT